MVGEIATIAVPVAFLAVLVPVLIRREDARLRRAAQQCRELALEGVEGLGRVDDPYPEERRVEGGWLREPDGRIVDGRRVLYEELARLREHPGRREMRRSRTPQVKKEASCLP